MKEKHLRIRSRQNSFPAALKTAGFTLLEVLVALVIIAVALAAATRASQLATDSALVMKQRLIGGWVAQNHLAELRLAQPQQFPSVGIRTDNVTQAGLQFTWQETVSETPNSAFRRVEVKVFAGGKTDYAVATLVGFLSNIK
ncbi:MAG: type II secretion system minor pseudopilin GspI [Pseudomonadota bacterium]